DLANQTKAVLDVDRKIDVIYNFVNEADYFKKNREYLKEEYGISKDDKVLIHISNFRKVKRIEDVIKTFASINKETKAKLILVDDGPESPTAFELVDELNITEDLISISDLLLLMSEQESFGLVILEAMACEVPSIGTNVGGIPEVINHGETGYLVELGDIASAAKYAINLLNDPKKLKEMKQAAYDRSKTQFHANTIVKEYLNLYKDVLT